MTAVPQGDSRRSLQHVMSATVRFQMPRLFGVCKALPSVLCTYWLLAYMPLSQHSFALSDFDVLPVCNSIDRMQEPQHYHLLVLL